MLVFSSAYNEYTVISKEYTGPLYFDITGVNCICIYVGKRPSKRSALVFIRFY